jgi:hypothetical protein
MPTATQTAIVLALARCLSRIDLTPPTPESAAFLVPGKVSFHGAFFLLTSQAMLPAWGKLPEITRIADAIRTRW